MNSKERNEERYQRRKTKRADKKRRIIESIGTMADVFTFKDMFKYGQDCCKNVRWKTSVQNFERHLFSRTAVNKRNVLNGYKPKKLHRFILNERGKTRNIGAPHIDDRQIQKTLTKKVLLPLYGNGLIYDNGASLKGKGLMFSQSNLDKALRWHIKKYGFTGYVIITDFKGFFPNADREYIKSRHLGIKDSCLRQIMDAIVNSDDSSDKGMPLGVEPSQLEMVAYPSALDNYMSCQVGLKGFGHYMDDYHILVPPNMNPHDVLDVFMSKVKEYGLTISPNKSKIVPIGKSFKFCKVTRVFQNSKIIKRGCRDSRKRARRKIKMLAREQDRLTPQDIYTSVQSMFAYFRRYNNHSTYADLTRLFYSLFGCTLEEYWLRNRTNC